MAMEQARAYLKQYHKEQDILVLDASSATVEQAAQALGTQPERIAKSLPVIAGWTIMHIRKPSAVRRKC